MQVNVQPFLIQFFKVSQVSFYLSFRLDQASDVVIWEEQAVTEDVAYAFEEEEQSDVEEQIASEAPEYVFEETVEEQTTVEEVAEAEIAFEENAEQVENVEESVYEDEDQIVTEKTAASSPVAVEGLVYTGEPQALILPQPGSWTYSLDGEEYSTELPTAVNAGEYTVYMKEGEKEVLVITVTIAKADVIFTPPVANTTNPSEVGEPENTGEEQAAFADLVERVE